VGNNRYTDFQVFEVTLDGQVVHLTDIRSVPAEHGAGVDDAASTGMAIKADPTEATVQMEETQDSKDTNGEDGGGEEERKRKEAEEEAREKEAQRKEKEEEEQRESEARKSLEQLLGEEEATKLFGWIQEVKAEQEERAKDPSTSSPAPATRGRGGRGRGRGGAGGGRSGAGVEYRELKLAPCDDKAHRAEIHMAFRKHFENFLDTKTQDGSVVVMVVGPAVKRRRRGNAAGGGGGGGRGQAQRNR